jgi:hypothetical protein
VRTGNFAMLAAIRELYVQTREQRNALPAALRLEVE